MNRSAKKVFLSVALIGVFIAYSLVIRGQKSESGPIVAAHKPLSNGASTATSSSPATSRQSGGNANPTSTGQYKNGTYTGSVADAYYGNIQVQATIQNGKITDVKFLQFPNDSPNSQSINGQAMPVLKQESIQAQSAHVDAVTGATQTSQAFIQSLTAALSQAQA